jgi:hypothetical protein
MAEYEAVFLDEDSGRDLRNMAELYFNLNINSLWSNDPLYLLITRNQDAIRKHRHRLGQRVRLTVTKIGWNPSLGVLVATVYLKSNFTCNPLPHITIMKNPRINQFAVNQIVTGWAADKTQTTFRALREPLIVRGRIGVTVDHIHEEAPLPGDPVLRPEMTVTVESAPPPPPLFENLDNYVRTALDEPVTTEHLEPRSSDGPISLDPPTISTGIRPPGTIAEGQTTFTADGQELYEGYPVVTGPKGGKYIIRDGKKVYLSVLLSNKVMTTPGRVGTGTTRNGVTYNVTTLSTSA